MNYDFATLSFTDFEALSRDLLGCELGIRSEAFPEGADDGMDGRHATGEGDVILQAKHYLRSGSSKLKSKLKTERAAIDVLAPQRYLLTTSASLTPMAKAELAEAIGWSLTSTSDIFGPDDLNALPRKYPNIEQAHPKSWQQSTGVMRAVLADAVRRHTNDRERAFLLMQCLALEGRRNVNHRRRPLPGRPRTPDRPRCRVPRRLSQSAPRLAKHAAR